MEGEREINEISNTLGTSPIAGTIVKRRCMGRPLSDHELMNKFQHYNKNMNLERTVPGLGALGDMD